MVYFLLLLLLLLLLIIIIIKCRGACRISSEGTHRVFFFFLEDQMISESRTNVSHFKLNKMVKSMLR